MNKPTKKNQPVNVVYAYHEHCPTGYNTDEEWTDGWWIVRVGHCTTDLFDCCRG